MRQSEFQAIQRLLAGVRRRFTPTFHEFLVVLGFLLSLLVGSAVMHWRSRPPPATPPAPTLPAAPREE